LGLFIFRSIDYTVFVIQGPLPGEAPVVDKA
jgi:hypothetical protein